MNLRQFLNDLKSRIALILVVFFLPLISSSQFKSTYSLKILGVVQDGGFPHLGNNKTCCENIQQKKFVTSIMLINNKNNESYLFDASPDINEQLNFMGDRINKDLKGIFLTHAHIGHYTGLMFFGREALNSNLINVFAMPRMKKFLETNGPWSQLVKLNNINLIQIHSESVFSLSDQIRITPFEVPHRGEFSETVGYKIHGPNKTALFIPDIDKWYLWEKSIVDEIREVDYALIDATFYDSKEVNYRDISEIPHPFVIETMSLFKNSSKKEKSKIYFIHLNHTNPLLDEKSKEFNDIINKGYNVAYEGLELNL
ncbi:MAG: pyrroloquinoline quinone biosynthesis protein PqqB [Cryomorphaceae bacterium MED-G14]|nr:MAG: pyrroloquinoline quinone biosynthesis protein PqqB [Cryomorphaceae bacterium MED-G14]|tara:strand:- start:2971 stop:3909 length:939 start_codon:yes stop_codon:yes gene_type:complete